MFISIYKSAKSFRISGIAILAAMLLCSCSGHSVVSPITPLPESDKNQEQAEIPEQELTRDVFYDLLVASLGLRYQNWEQSYQATYSAALSSGDPRLTRQAAALALHIMRDYTKAAQASDLWRQQEPELEAARLIWITSYVGLGLVEQVLPEVQTYINTAQSPFEDRIKVISELLVGQTNDVAVAVMSQLQALYPQQEAVLLQSAVVAHYFQQMDLADKWLQQAITLKPGYEQAILLRYQVLRSEQGSEQADNYLLQAMQDASPARLLRNQYLWSLYQQQNYEKVVSQTSNLSRKHKDDASAWFVRGVSLLNLEKYKLAQRALQRVLAIDANDDRAKYQLGIAAYQQQNYQQAIDWHRQVTDAELLFGARLEIARSLAKAYPGKVGVRRALRQLESVEAKNNLEFRRFALLRHQILQLDQQSIQALGYMSDALAVYPDDASLLYARGLVASELMEVDIAEADLRRVIELQPKNATALNALGYTLADLTNRYAEARELIEQALLLQPDSFYILDSMGWVLFKQGEFELAVDYLQRAYAQAPEAEIAAHLGEVLYASGSKQRAEEIWMLAIEQYPDNDILKRVIKKYLPEEPK